MIQKAAVDAVDNRPTYRTPKDWHLSSLPGRPSATRGHALLRSGSVPWPETAGPAGSRRPPAECQCPRASPYDVAGPAKPAQAPAARRDRASIRRPRPASHARPAGNYRSSHCRRSCSDLRAENVFAACLGSGRPGELSVEVTA